MAAPIVPVVVGLGLAGALAFALGGKNAQAKPDTHKPKKKAPTVSSTSEAAIIAAMRNPAAMKKLIDEVAATGDPVKLWNLGRTMLLNSKGNPTMQAAASAVLAKAVLMAMKSGNIAPLVSTALKNGDAEILAQAAASAAALDPSLAGRLQELANQLRRSGQKPAAPRPSTKPAKDKDDANAAKAAQAATQVVADAIKATEQVEKDPPQAPVPNVPPTPTRVVTTIPETVVTAAPPTGEKKAAFLLTTYLESLGAARDHTLRFKEDRKRVGTYQKEMGVNADGNYGPGSASKVASLGVVPVPPFYWTKGKAAAQKAAYKQLIATMQAKFPDEDWKPALKGVDVS